MENKHERTKVSFKVAYEEPGNHPAEIHVIAAFVGPGNDEFEIRKHFPANQIPGETPRERMEYMIRRTRSNMEYHGYEVTGSLGVHHPYLTVARNY